MRTSPLGMRRILRRAPSALIVILVLLVATGAACSDDGDDDTSSPTTTAPASSTTEADDPGEDDVSTTTTDGTETTETTEPGGTPEGGSVPGDDAQVLDVEQATAQLDALIARYRAAVAGAAASGALDERSLVIFNRAFTGSRAQQELQGLQEAGIGVLNPTPPGATVTEVVLTEAVGGCAAGTAVIEGLSGLVTVPVEVVQPYYFRLVPAADGASAPAWRLDFFNFSNNGVPLEADAACS